MCLTSGALTFCQTARCREDIACGLEYNDDADPVGALYRSDLAEHLRKLCLGGDLEAARALDDASAWLKFVQSTAHADVPDYHYKTLCDEKAEALRRQIRAHVECGARRDLPETTSPQDAGPLRLQAAQ